MRRLFHDIIFIFLVAVSVSCSVNRRLPPGEKLYYGAEVNIKKMPGVKTKSSELRKELADIATPKRNKMLFGQPYKVWWWYVIGQPKKEKGFKNWLRNTLGQAPILSQDLSPALNAQNMKALLENEGYFNSTVVGDTFSYKKKIKVRYRATVERPYLIGSVKWRLDTSRLEKDIVHLPNSEARLKTGDQYNADKIKTEKDRLTLLLKGIGYYYFEPSHFVTYVDTNHKNYTAAIYMALSHPLPAQAKIPYTINRITVYTPYTALRQLPDSFLQALPQYKGIYIYDSSKKFKQDIFARAITFRKGNLYSLAEQNKTQVRLNSLGTFRFIKTQFTQVPDSKDLMDVTYFMAPYQKRKLQTEIGGFTRSNSYSGGQLSIQWANKNVLRGAEYLTIKATGSFELTPNDSLSENNNWRLGVEAALNIPKLLVPFRRHRTFAYFPKTRFPLSYDWIRHQNLYTEHYFHTRYELNWSDTVTKEYRFIPFSLTITNTANFTSNFNYRQLIDSNLDLILPTIIIPSTSFQYIVNNTSANKRNITRIHTGIELAGTILGLIKGNNGYFSTKIGESYFMQYVKAGIDFRYYRKLGPEKDWANRVIIGGSYPYGNSPFLPFSRQYIIGGASSLRGFIPRHIGPGSAQATEQQQSAFPQIGGDYKLELNSELRLPLTGQLKGAIFMDAGNIWMKDSILYKKEGQLTKDFYKQIALDAGLGLRVDVTILVIRLDLAIPLYKPWLPEGERWAIKEFNPGSSDWRKENLIWNFALGYPF